MDAVREWCRQECIRQHATTDEDFAGMEKAWEYAKARAEVSLGITIGSIRHMAFMIDPAANPNGRFRTGPAVFMNGGSSANAHDIEYHLRGLVINHDRFGFTPAEFYQELMYIHPFKDGNGRVGALVYNILNGTILNPVVPPEYKG